MNSESKTFTAKDPVSGLSVADAAQRLQEALKALEGALKPIEGRLNTLEAATRDKDVFAHDRTRIANELDIAKASEQSLLEKQKAFSAREAEFGELAGETMQELDAVISQVKLALGKSNGQGTR